MKRLLTAAIASMLLLTSLGLPASAGAATPLVTARASLTTFSPDADGSNDTVAITYRLSARSRVWVRIYRGTTLVRTLLAGPYRSAGSSKATWNGLKGSGSPAATGSYRWVVTAKRGTRTVSVRSSVSLTRAVAEVPAVPAATTTSTLPATPTVPTVPATSTIPTVPTAPTVDRWIGSYVPGAPLSIQPLVDLESKIGTQAAVSNYFQNTSQGFTWTQATNVADHGSIPLITLEFWDPARGVSQPSFSLKAIADGGMDTYLRKYAADAASFGRTVWLRPFHEMNGDWYPWGGTVNGNSSADFIAAWRHVRAIFNEAGAANVKFVWAPNVDSVPNTTANAISAYWPGDAYVDYVALDGYNFGGSSSAWRSFGSVFGPAYSKVTALTSKPLFIAETACATVGGDKAAWIADMFKTIPARYPRIIGVTWFNANKERDWRVESSAECLGSFRTGAALF